MVKNHSSGINEIYFQGEKGKIYGLYHKAADENAPVILILHGHPKNNLGSYNNPIIQAILRAAVRNDFTALAISYRGSEKSSGTYIKPQDGLIDASYALDWLHREHENNYKFWVAGFSYGSWVAAQLATRRPEIVGLVLISSLLFKYDYSFMNPFPCLGLIIHGDLDSATKFKELKDFFDQDIFKNYQHKIHIKKLHNCDHFFYKEAPRVNEMLEETCYEFFKKHRNEEIQIQNYLLYKDDEDDDYITSPESYIDDSDDDDDKEQKVSTILI